jgi:hypothetical protein
MAPNIHLSNSPTCAFTYSNVPYVAYACSVWQWAWLCRLLTSPVTDLSSTFPFRTSFQWTHRNLYCVAYVMWVCTDPCSLAARGYAIHPHLEAIFAVSSLSCAMAWWGRIRCNDNHTHIYRRFTFAISWLCVLENSWPGVEMTANSCGRNVWVGSVVSIFCHVCTVKPD